MNMARRPTWFATLRRDRGLFALIGCLILLLNVLQPVTAAKAAENGLWVICTVYGAEKPVDGSDLPAPLQEKCPICLFGHGGQTGAGLQGACWPRRRPSRRRWRCRSFTPSLKRTRISLRDRTIRRRRSAARPFPPEVEPASNRGL
ncbi:MAG: hypothetical protein KL801_14435 [Mesorhizobium sp.]|nr:hypothetical protein [Mesorhizobium sp.]